MNMERTFAVPMEPALVPMRAVRKVSPEEREHEEKRTMRKRVACLLRTTSHGAFERIWRIERLYFTISYERRR